MPGSSDTTASTTPFVVDLDDPHALDARLVGVKGASLARLRAGGFATPDGFVVTTACLRETVRSGGIEQKLATIWDAAATAAPGHISALAHKARHLMSALSIDAGATLDIVDRLAALGDDVRLAVRSSVTPDSVSGPACAGVHATFTDVSGASSVLSRIRGCWASLYGERALMMRSRGLGDDSPVGAVVVQPMVAADASGIIVPVAASNDVLVEATFGLGEPLFSGAVEPDRYVVDATTGVTRSVVVNRKQVILEAGGGHAFAPLDVQRRRVLDDGRLAALAQLGTRIEEHFAGPHEIEWVLVGSEPIVLQVRPVDPTPQPVETSVDRMVTGIGVGVGTASGRVRIVTTIDDIDPAVDGAVFVTRETSPEWRPHLERAAAIVTDIGDEHSHAANVARECGIPAVVGTATATSDLEEGSTVAVDAERGWILPLPRG